jgi:hypothetical protein
MRGSRLISISSISPSASSVVARSRPSIACMDCLAPIGSISSACPLTRARDGSGLPSGIQHSINEHSASMKRRTPTIFSAVLPSSAAGSDSDISGPVASAKGITSPAHSPAVHTSSVVPSSESSHAVPSAALPCDQGETQEQVDTQDQAPVQEQTPPVHRPATRQVAEASQTTPAQAAVDVSTQAPSPKVQARESPAACAHGVPEPLAATLTEKVRLSHAAVQALASMLQAPTQSTLRGHRPSPGKH